MIRNLGRWKIEMMSEIVENYVKLVEVKKDFDDSLLKQSRERKIIKRGTHTASSYLVFRKGRHV